MFHFMINVNLLPMFFFYLSMIIKVKTDNVKRNETISMNDTDFHQFISQ